LELSDHSSIAPDSGALARVVADSPAAMEVELVRGSARFDVQHNPSRIFRVNAGAVTVEVLGTRFNVARTAERVRVAVDRGRVRVAWAGGDAELAAGQADWFPPTFAPQPAPQAPAPVPAAAEPPTSRPARASPPHHPVTVGSRAPAAPDAAAEPVDDTVKQIDRNEVAELLESADLARLEHRPSDAVARLTQLLRKHPDDPRASLAAFTLGRVLLDDLGRPREAAAAFAQAGALSPGGALAEDALAREVEAWSRAGETSRAHARAEDYLRGFPDGRRAVTVRRYGGIE
jgi:transmembrane sensor